MKMRQVGTTLDEETIEAVRAYGIAAGHSGMYETYRELILEGLRSKTVRPYSTVVRQQVKEELDRFMAEMAVRLELMAADVADTIDDRMSAELETNTVATMASLRIVSDLAAVQPGEFRDAEEVRADACAGLWQVSSQLGVIGNN